MTHTTHRRDKFHLVVSRAAAPLAQELSNDITRDPINGLPPKVLVEPIFRSTMNFIEACGDLGCQGARGLSDGRIDLSHALPLRSCSGASLSSQDSTVMPWSARKSSSAPIIRSMNARLRAISLV